MEYAYQTRSPIINPMCSAVLRVSMLALLLCFLAQSSFAAWTQVGNGIEYQKFTLTNPPNNVFVARMLQSNTNATIETCMAQGKVYGVRETPSSMSARLDNAINYAGQTWGQRNDVIVTINGDFEMPDQWGVSASGLVHSGWYAKRFTDMTGGSGFAWMMNRYPIIGGCVYHRPERQIVKFAATGNTIEFSGINIPRESGQLFIYTPQYGASTGTSNEGVEVVVELTRPLVIIPTPNKVIGYVREIRQNQGNTPIPFDSVVLSATGSAANTLLANVSIGAEVWISQEITNYQSDCSTPWAIDWTKAYAAIGGGPVVLKSGVVPTFTDPGMTTRHPRTAIAYNSTYVFFVVCDGRRPGVSEGMTGEELGNFCKNTLQATDAINQDGGWSSVMIVNGTIVNNPSDGSERAVTNGIMMVNILPKAQSTRFSVGQTVVTTTTTNVRLGPGTNYAVLTTVPAGASGTVLNHSLNGVLAKGYNWWKVDFSGTKGWVAESLLSGCTPPTAVTVSDEGTWTPSLSTLKAYWTSSSAPCGLSRYEYAVGTSPTSQNVKPWTSAGLSTSVVDYSLTLTEGQTYYIQVRAVDVLGQVGPTSASDGITVAPRVDPIGAAWTLSNSTGLSIRNKVVTATKQGAFWLEEQNRSAAIKVVSSASVTRGNKVSVAGVLGMSGTQRALIGDVVINSGGTWPIPSPLGMGQLALGGASLNALTPSVTDGKSAYNIGLLVKCWGTVTYSDSSNPNDKFFCIDDGSGLSDGSGHRGVKVRCGSVSPPNTGIVMVTGIVASEQVVGKVVPVILIRDENDIVVL